MLDALNPVGRLAPSGVRRALETVDPRAEMVYLGFGDWQIVRLRPHTNDRLMVAGRVLRQAYERCAKGKGSERTWMRALWQARLARVGYTLGPIYHVQGEPTDYHVRDFQHRLWDVERERDFLTRIDEAEEAKKAQAIEAYSDPSRCREASRAMRNPVTFTVPGLKRTA